MWPLDVHSSPAEILPVRPCRVGHGEGPLHEPHGGPGVRHLGQGSGPPPHRMGRTSRSWYRRSQGSQQRQNPPQPVHLENWPPSRPPRESRGAWPASPSTLTLEGPLEELWIWACPCGWAAQLRHCDFKLNLCSLCSGLWRLPLASTPSSRAFTLPFILSRLRAYVTLQRPQLIVKKTQKSSS